MRIGLIDVDASSTNKNSYPNLVLMKLSAWHKAQGDSVEWFYPLSGHFDKVYMSKVFSFTKDYEWAIDADVIEKGGTGYCISLKDGKEVFDNTKHKELPYEIEHIMPDYSLYGITDTAYGYMSRGCPRQCSFCHVAAKEGCISRKVADLSEFWSGQKNIVLCDPNTLACKDWRDILQQLIDSKAFVDFNQGVDIRLMTPEKCELFAQVKCKVIHFAWDRYEDKAMIQPKFELFRSKSKISDRDLRVYVLCGDRERRVLPTDLERIYWLRDNGYDPYVMIYDKASLPRGHELKKLQRWVNNKFIFRSCDTFQEYGRQGGTE